MKTWILDTVQHVNVDNHRNVYFKHYTKMGRRGITLSWRQFLNLNDIMMDLDTFHSMRYYPLGNQIWLQYFRNQIQIYHTRFSIYFTFREACWIKYKRETHKSILSFLQHGRKRSLHHREHTPSDENLFQIQARNITPSDSKQQILSGSPSDVAGENEQRKESSNLSKWDSSNHRRPFSFIGAVHALRAAENTTPVLEEGELCDIESDCGQFSNLCSIE